MKVCKDCGKEVSKSAKTCPGCGAKLKKNKALSFILIFIGIMIFINGVSSLMKEDTKNVDKEEKCAITLNEFNNIENGMSYEQVRDIVGCEGTVLSEVGEKGTEYYTIMYSWYAENGIANANFTFQNNKLITKAQLGLE